MPDFPLKTRAAVAALLLGTTAAVRADDIPHRKAGLWQIQTRTATSTRPEMVERICLDRETEALLDRAAVASVGQSCSKSDVHVAGSHVTIKATCNMGASRMSSEASITFEGDSAYHTVIHATFDPPIMSRRTSDSVQDARWTGSCPADMKPGDLIMQTQGPHPREHRLNLRTLLAPAK
jgi:Protein of unknown function (DUF3617)